MAFSLPILAATLAFVTYTHVVAGFDVAIIFSSLSLFQVFKMVRVAVVSLCLLF